MPSGSPRAVTVSVLPAIISMGPLSALGPRRNLWVSWQNNRIGHYFQMGSAWWYRPVHFTPGAPADADRFHLICSIWGKELPKKEKPAARTPPREPHLVPLWQQRTAERRKENDDGRCNPPD